MTSLFLSAERDHSKHSDYYKLNTTGTGLHPNAKLFVALALTQYNFLSRLLYDVGRTGVHFSNTAHILRMCHATSGEAALYRVDTNQAISITAHQWCFLKQLHDAVHAQVVVLPPFLHVEEEPQDFNFDKNAHSTVPTCDMCPAQHIVYPGTWLPKQTKTTTVSVDANTNAVISIDLSKETQLTTTTTLPSTASEPTFVSASKNLENLLATFPTKEETEAQLTTSIDLQTHQLAQALLLSRREACEQASFPRHLSKLCYLLPIPCW